MQKKARQGRMLPKRGFQMICKGCGGDLEYGGTYREGQICINTVDLATCHECKLAHNILWLRRNSAPIIYPTTGRDMWIWNAGHRVGLGE